jgi:hypothetical protein
LAALPFHAGYAAVLFLGAILLLASALFFVSAGEPAAPGLRANWIYLKVGARWGLGFRKGLERHYPDVR